MAKFNFVALSVFAAVALADVAVEYPPTREMQAYYANQFNQNYDTMVQSNIVNQQKLRANNELTKDMLPCRSDLAMEPVTLARGSSSTYILRFNNPHDGQCEINLWTPDNQVMSVLAPTPCGGGFRREELSYTIPANAPAICNTPGACKFQFYYYSVEPRDYALCTDLTLTGAPQGEAAALRPGKFFSDGFDSDYVDAEYNAYRGQQEATPKLQTRWALRSAVGIGREAKAQNLISQSLQNEKNQLANQINNAITAAENTAKNQLRAQDRQLQQQANNLKKTQANNLKAGRAAFYPAQKAYAGQEEYNLFMLEDNNSARQTQNTYIPLNYDPIFTQYSARLNNLSAKLQNANALFAPSEGAEAPGVALQNGLNRVQALKA